MIEGDYEYETGFQIINCLKERNLSYEEMEMILVGSHAPFAWGKSVEKLFTMLQCWKNLRK